jgi:hypothetical protein
VVRYSSEPFGYCFRVNAVHLPAGVPPVLGTFEEVGFAILVGESGVYISWETLPPRVDSLRVSGSDRVLRQLPVVVTYNNVLVGERCKVFYNTFNTILEIQFTFKGVRDTLC